MCLTEDKLIKKNNFKLIQLIPVIVYLITICIFVIPDFQEKLKLCQTISTSVTMSAILPKLELSI